MRPHSCQLLFIAMVLFACAPAPRKQPDVILISLDTTRADRLGVYGHDRRVSPALDRFAADAIVFENAWSTASWTLPSHASLLSGRYPTAHGAHVAEYLGRDPDAMGDNPAYLPEEIVTLAELLAEQGYRGAAFAGAGWLAPEFGLLQGYEVREATRFESLPANEITDHALAWVREIPPQQPIHLLINYFDPHWPYTPPKAFDVFSGDGPRPAAATQMVLEPPKGATREALLDLYDAEILFMDHHLGRLFDGLRELGRFEDALIVVISDHGELFGEHGYSGHGAWLYEEVLRIPMIVRLPGGRAGGRRLEAPASLVDVLPIIAAELGLTLPEGVDGRDPRGVSPAARVILAEEFPNALLKHMPGAGLDRDLVAGIRFPWKLIEDSDGNRQLFDVHADPGEQTPRDEGDVELELHRDLDQLRTSLTPPETAGARRNMSPEAREQLKALGYIE